jgi:hypothetical protein
MTQKAGIVEPEETSTAREQLDKHVHTAADTQAMIVIVENGVFCSVRSK